MPGIGTLPGGAPVMAITAAAPPDTADFGDFVSTEDEEVDLEEVVEPWHKYDMKETPYVFYPICVGEVLNERYLVEHKLGFGGFSTVWMAYDLQEKRNIALKVMSSGECRDYETRIQDEIVQNI
ncbi:kinase domain-containing protein [Penicillium psychrosexuale]|uniref:kinase domain-containing protein n=1 Tax=Penicillium psychrosexuale TaxID=1002107 RepID=UPI0025456BE7|nr:kinase domain-containing protein [Penicillium psychrosexuale]KAJ5799263.1 kinase domain-containing protein [Penicillium psychrosexuale]